MPTLQKLTVNYGFELIFNEAEHVYTIDGTMVPGVTTITDLFPKKALVPWAAKMTTEYLDGKWEAGKPYSASEKAILLKEAKAAHRVKTKTAADYGSAAHEWIEQYIKTGQRPPDPVIPEVLSSVTAFLEWEKAHRVEWLASELRVASKEHMFAGTLDAMAVIDGWISLVDFKTSNAIYESHFVQTAGYMIGFEEGSPVAFNKRFILRFPKDGKGCEALEIPTSYVQDRQTFLAALEFYKCLRGYKSCL